MVTVYLFIWTTPKSEGRAGAYLAGPNFPVSNDSGPKTDRSYCEHHWVQIFDPLLYELIKPDAVTEFSTVIFQGKGMKFWDGKIHNARPRVNFQGTTHTHVI